MDIGCGSGEYLSSAKAAGWNVRGIEASKRGAANACIKGLNVKNADIETAIMNFSDNYFDYINLSHVIEHVAKPLDIFFHCRIILSPKGRLFISTPNFESFDSKLFGIYWKHLSVPQHTQFFGRNSLIYALENAGFKNIKPYHQPVLPHKIQDLSFYSIHFILKDKSLEIIDKYWLLIKTTIRLFFKPFLASSQKCPISEIISITAE